MNNNNEFHTPSGKIFHLLACEAAVHGHVHPAAVEVWHGVISGISHETCTNNWHRR